MLLFENDFITEIRSTWNKENGFFSFFVRLFIFFCFYFYLFSSYVSCFAKLNRISDCILKDFLLLRPNLLTISRKLSFTGPYHFTSITYLPSFFMRLLFHLENYFVTLFTTLLINR